MKNTIGESFAITLFGESHGPYIGFVLDGIAPGIKIDEERIRQRLSLRRPSGKISTARVEMDEFKIISGAVDNVTTGTALTVIIENTNTKSSDYDSLKNCPRPSHADYTATLKYHGYQDARGGGHFSGRITAALVVAGAIASDILENKGIYIGSHIKKCGSVEERSFDEENLKEEILRLNNQSFACLENDKAEEMVLEAEKAALDLDSVGGIVETAVYGLMGGLGEPWFDTLEGVLAKYIFSVPAIKGVEFGAGFSITDKRGSEANDNFFMKDGDVLTLTNNSGGIQGGISNGMPIIIRSAVKPTPSIYKKQNTVDLKENSDTTLEIKGRHDPAIVHRARIVIDSVVALALVDMCSLRYGTDWQK
ncbi:MAG: chorismate synthase [Erysipelotrichaceae bacterium]|nr:chorismate synthase [Erysipelotrichaceae bacterium]